MAQLVCPASSPLQGSPCQDCSCRLQMPMSLKYPRVQSGDDDCASADAGVQEEMQDWTR